MVVIFLLFFVSIFHRVI